MSAIPEEIEVLVARIATNMPGGDMPTITLRWESSGAVTQGVSSAQRRELHTAVTRLRADERGGVLVAVLPLGAEEDGPLVESIKETVIAAVGDGNLEDFTAEALEGIYVAFHLAHGEVPPALSAELDVIDCSTRELRSDVFQRASRSAGFAAEDNGFVVLTRVEQQMVGLLAATSDEGRIKATVAGVLAFHPAPSRLIPGAHFVVGLGSDAGSQGPVSEAVQAAARWVAQYGFPEYAVAELLWNAWLHRDWSVEARATPIRILVQNRRVDIVSPGALGDMTAPPNPVLRDLCHRAGLIKALGQGLDDLWADLAEDNRFRLDIGTFGASVRARLTLVKGESAAAPGVAAGSRVVSAARPALHVQHQAAAVRKPEITPLRQAAAGGSQAVPRTPTAASPRGAAQAAPARVAPPSSVKVAKPAPISAPVHVAGNARDEQLVALVADRGEVSSRMIQEDLGWTRSTTRDVLARLVSLGRLRRTVEDPRSPMQGYRLA